MLFEHFTSCSINLIRRSLLSNCTTKVHSTLTSLTSAPTCTSPTRLLSTQLKQSTQTTVSTDSGAEEESLPPLVTGNLFCMHLCIMKHEINYLWNQHSHSLWDQSILWARTSLSWTRRTHQSSKLGTSPQLMRLLHLVFPFFSPIRIVTLKFSC